MLETLSDGSSRLRGERCSFATRRLRPGVLLTRVRGRDEGELGTAPLAMVEREHARFRLPVRWFIDAREVQGASAAVLDTWTRWLSGRPACLAGLHVLPREPMLAVNMGIVRYLSRSDEQMQLHDNAPAFDAALRAEATGVSWAVPSEDPAAVRITHQPLAGGGFEVRGPQLAYRFERLDACTILTRARGCESGELGDEVWDAFDALLERSSRPVRWRLDLSGITHVQPDRAAAWSAWLTVREPCFRDIVVLAPAAGVALFLLDAQYRFSSQVRMRVVRDAAEFARSLPSPEGGASPGH